MKKKADACSRVYVDVEYAEEGERSEAIFSFKKSGISKAMDENQTK